MAGGKKGRMARKVQAPSLVSPGRAFCGYHKVELYVPLEFSREETGELVRIPYLEIVRLCDQIGKRFHGYTSTNPATPPQFLGYWEGWVDRLFYIFVLVESKNFPTDQVYFWELKEELECRYNQKVLLVTHYELQSLGKL